MESNVFAREAVMTLGLDAAIKRSGDQTSLSYAIATGAGLPPKVFDQIDKAMRDDEQCNTPDSSPDLALAADARLNVQFALATGAGVDPLIFDKMADARLRGDLDSVLEMNGFSEAVRREIVPPLVSRLSENRGTPTRAGDVNLLARLPDVPPAIFSQRESRSEGIVDFLSRVWGKWIDAKLLTRRDLRKLDPSADKAVENFLLRNPLPDHIFLPTRKKINDALLAEYTDDALKVASRLDSARRRRR